MLCARGAVRLGPRRGRRNPDIHSLLHFQGVLCTDLGAVACRSDRSSGGVVSNQHCARASCDALAEGQQITSRVGLGGRADAKGEYRHGHTAIAAGGHAAGTQRAVVVAQGVDDATLAYAGAGDVPACCLPPLHVHADPFWQPS